MLTSIKSTSLYRIVSSSHTILGNHLINNSQGGFLLRSYRSSSSSGGGGGGGGGGSEARSVDKDIIFGRKSNSSAGDNSNSNSNGGGRNNRYDNRDDRRDDRRVDGRYDNNKNHTRRNEYQRSNTADYSVGRTTKYLVDNNSNGGMDKSSRREFKQELNNIQYGQQQRSSSPRVSRQQDEPKEEESGGEGVVEQLPKDELHIVGLHTVLETFKCRPESFQRLYINKETYDKQSAALGAIIRHMVEHKLPYRFFDKEDGQMERVAKNRHHEGVCAVIKSKKVLTPEEAFEKEMNKTFKQTPPVSHSFTSTNKQTSGETNVVRPIVVLLDGVENPMNIGSIVRTCAGFGVETLYLFNQEGASASGRVNPFSTASYLSSRGAIEHLDVIPITARNTAINMIKEFAEQKWEIVSTATAISDKALTLFSEGSALTLGTKPLLLIFGSESHGINPGIAKLSTATLTIPGTGLIDSLNVSQSAAIILAECWRIQGRRLTGNSRRSRKRKKERKKEMTRSSNESDDEELSSSEENYKHNGKSHRRKSSSSLEKTTTNNNDDDDDDKDDGEVEEEEEEENGDQHIVNGEQKGDNEEDGHHDDRDDDNDNENNDDNDGEMHQVMEQDQDENDDENNNSDKQQDEKEEEEEEEQSDDQMIKEESRIYNAEKKDHKSLSSSSSSSSSSSLTKSTTTTNTTTKKEGTQVDPADLDALTNLIVHNIPKHFTNEDLKDLFEEFGEIESYKVVANRKAPSTLLPQQPPPQANMGYGFVKFVHSESAAAAIESMNGHMTDSKTIKVSYATPTSQQSTHANLYINRLEPHVTKEDLAEAFSKFGELVETRILMDLNTNTSRCVGFVHFSNRRDALAALSAMNGANISQQSTPIYVKFADQKDDNKKNKVTKTKDPNDNRLPIQSSSSSSSSLQQHMKQQKHSNNNGGNNTSSKHHHHQKQQQHQQQQQIHQHQPQIAPAISGYQYMDHSGLLGSMAIPPTPAAYNPSIYMYPMASGGGGVYRNTNPPSRYDPIGRNLLTNQYHHHPASIQAASNPYPFSYYPPQISPIQTQLLNLYNTQAYVQQPPPPLNYSLLYSVHVSNLPNNSDEAYIYKLFGALGAIANVKMLNNHQAIINYLTIEAAQNAIVNLNNKSVGGKTLKVKSQ
ncbi:hypothetical protein DFA_03608 [Cavenderia fasciculata]|uniref:RRM domain-containing protein n=1 Tax=Cavenderia fasciculata TaxID=261658 RepID=F4PI76_CACFS|nr:uncharacterized protein DFA_03608 [Cavenderia fasciculata]EGG25359.1 hypothetical protein DFA_03608 [Cavenderia fasciculata]|eukprot:XP_004363210.1 hypothetical protein DFA_03608 [Cavenderia fasciculata]